MKMRYKITIAVGAIAAIAAAGAAFAASPSTAQSRHGGGGWGQWHVVHSEAEVVNKNGQFASIVIDRGKVTNVSSGSITIERKDGRSVTVSPGPKTRIRYNGHKAQLSDISVGDFAQFAQLERDGSTTVYAIRAWDHEPGRHGASGSPAPIPSGSATS
ncbi:MAG: hypothetical protein ACYDCC_03625 [Actinomycetota bacterium]